jgi:hypothetical protein
MPKPKGKFTGRIPNGRIIDELIRRDHAKESISLLKKTRNNLLNRATTTRTLALKQKNPKLKNKLINAAKRDEKKADSIHGFLYGK